MNDLVKITPVIEGEILSPADIQAMRQEKKRLQASADDIQHEVLAKRRELLDAGILFSEGATPYLEQLEARRMNARALLERSWALPVEEVTPKQTKALTKAEKAAYEAVIFDRTQQLKEKRRERQRMQREIDPFHR